MDRSTIALTLMPLLIGAAVVNADSLPIFPTVVIQRPLIAMNTTTSHEEKFDFNQIVGKMTNRIHEGSIK